ncbi:MAG: hypothetical protein ACI4QR_06520 [Eubacteriales bacterium]
MKKDSTKENKKAVPDGSGDTALSGGRTTLQKQYIFIIIAAVLALLFIIFYFAIYPKIKKSTDLITYLYDGEYREGSILYIVGPTERKYISKIEVKNTFGLYTVEADNSESDAKKFSLVGGGKVVLDEYSLAGLIVNAAKPMAIAMDSKNYRADEYATKEDLKKYGLDEASDPAWFRVTMNDGSSYRIFIGNPLSAGRGCYAYLEDETRKNVVTNEDGTTSEYYIIYVFDINSAATMLAGETAVVSTNIGAYVGNGIYNLSNFEIYRNIGKERRLIVRVVENTSTDNIGVSNITLDYPAAYMLDENTFYESVLSSLASISADAVMAIGEKIYSPEIYEKYALDLDPERLENGTDNNYAKLIYKCLDSAGTGTYENSLYFSEKQLMADGTTCFYVYVPELDMIVQISAEAFDFVTWSSMKFTNARLFFSAIGSLDYFSLLSADGKTDVRFALQGTAYTYHVDVTDAAGEKVLLDKNGNKIVYDVEYEKTAVQTIFKGTFENFRDLYYVLITRMIDKSMDTVEIDTENEKPVYILSAQTLPRDRDEQFYKYENDKKVVENGSYVTVSYTGGNISVSNLKGTSANGITLTYDNAYYSEKDNKYFLKATDSADGEIKPKNFKYSENEIVPIYLSLTDATSEYTVTNNSYEFYNLYYDVETADGTVTKKINPTYMIVVPTVTKNVYRIESDGKRTLVSSETIGSDGLGSLIRRTSVEKLFSDAGKVLAGESIDKMAVD